MGCTVEIVGGEFDEIRARLETIAEELADLAIIRLRESIDAGGTELPVDEPVWLRPADVAVGRDSVVEAAARWLSREAAAG